MTVIFALLLTLGLLAVVAADLIRVVRGDGYGRRPAPRSRDDDDEPRPATLARLAR